MEEEFHKKSMSLSISYDNVDKKIILGFINKNVYGTRQYDYYILDNPESSAFISFIESIKVVFNREDANPEKTHWEKYIQPTKIKLPTSRRETHYGNLAIKAPMIVALPQKQIPLLVQEAIVNACGDFMEALGYELEVKEEPIYGSFFQIFNFNGKHIIKTEVKELYKKGKLALETQHISVPSAEATSKLAEAASRIITSLDNVEEAALRLGALLVIKVKRDGKVTVSAETISPSLALILDENPSLLKHPSAVMELISGETERQKAEAEKIE